jgi:hypothetical protein
MDSVLKPGKFFQSSQVCEEEVYIHMHNYQVYWSLTLETSATFIVCRRSKSFGFINGPNLPKVFGLICQNLAHHRLGRNQWRANRFCGWKLCDGRWQLALPGIDVIITIFCDFGRKIVVFPKTKCYDQHFCKDYQRLSKNGKIFAKFVGENIVKIITLVPEHSRY